MSLLPFPVVENINSLYDFDRIFDFLGNGNFATVFKAVRRSDGLEVALKVVVKRELTSDRMVKDIINEVEILRRLRHKHCVALHDVLQTGTEVFLVLTLCKNGGELFDVITKTMPQGMPEGLAGVVARQLCDALRYLHAERRVVHRDVKPENIIISPSSGVTEANVHVTLVDFGLAKYVGTANRLRLRPSGFTDLASLHAAVVTTLPQRSMSMDSVESADSHSNSPIVATPCGTMKYTAPEVLRGLMETGGSPRQTTRGSLQKTDMFSVGIIAHIMLSGRLPFNGKAKAELAAQMDRGLAFEGRAWTQVSDEAKDFVMRLLQLDPAKRMSAEEALRHPWISVDCPQRTMSTACLDELGVAEEDTAQYDDIVTDREHLNAAFSGMMPADEESSDSSPAHPDAYPPPGTSLRAPPTSLMAPQLLHPPSTLPSRRSACHTVPFKPRTNYFQFGPSGGGNDAVVPASEEN